MLYLFTDSGTTAAKHTFTVVADHMRCTFIRLGRCHLTGIFLGIIHTQLPAELHKLTVAAAHAGQAVLAVIGQQQLQCLLSGIHHGRGIGPYLHAVIDRVNTGSHQASCSFYFYNAHPAGADLVDVFQITECGDLHLEKSCGLQNGNALRDSALYSV